MEKELELHEKKFCFKGKDLKNSIIEDFRFSLKNNEAHQNLEFPALVQEVTNFYSKENEIQIVGYSILEYLTAEQIAENFEFEIDGKKLVFSEMKLPIVIFNDQDAEQWQIKLMELVLTPKQVEEIVEKEEPAEGGLSGSEEELTYEISFAENEKPVINDSEGNVYLFDGEIGDTMTFSKDNKVLEYNKDTQEITVANEG